MPFVDIAYQGFGRGLDEDAFGVRLMLEACDEVIIAQSCDKNFSVYRDRVGSLFVKTGSASATEKRHGACLPAGARDVVDAARPWRGGVHIVLEDAELRARWLVELEGMRDRINSVRQRIAAADPRLAFIGGQYRHVLDAAAEQGAGAEAARRRTRSTWPTAAASTSSAWATTQIDRFIAAVVGALDA